MIRLLLITALLTSISSFSQNYPSSVETPSEVLETQQREEEELLLEQEMQEEEAAQGATNSYDAPPYWEGQDLENVEEDEWQEGDLQIQEEEVQP